MRIGLGVFLMALGAIVAWALPGLWSIDGVEWSMIGYILIAAGAIVTIFSIIMMTRSRNTSQVTHTNVDPTTGSRVDRTERRDDI